MIRSIHTKDFPAAQALWLESFPDDDAFCRLFFQRQVDKDHSLGLWDVELAAQLFWVDYQLCARHLSLPVSFVVGVSTATHRRRQGLAKQLMSKMLTCLRQQHRVFALLSPFNEEFYRQYGWEACYPGSIERAIQMDAALPVEPSFRLEKQPSTAQLQQCYKRSTANYNGYVLRNEADWRYRLDQFAPSGGWVAAVCQKDELLAYAMGEKAQIQEQCAHSPEASQALTAYLMREKSPSLTALCDAAPHENAGPATMARIVDMKAVLDLFLNDKPLPFVIAVEDRFAPWNHCCYAQDPHHGSWYLSDQSCDISADIGAYTQLFLGHRSASALAQEARLAAKPSAITMLDMLLPVLRNRIFEKY